jgi:hypothetical protein
MLYMFIFYVYEIVFFVLNFTFKCFVDLTLFVVTRLCWNILIVNSIVLLGFFFTSEQYFKFISYVTLCWVQSLNPLKFNGLLH